MHIWRMVLQVYIINISNAAVPTRTGGLIQTAFLVLLLSPEPMPMCDGDVGGLQIFNISDLSAPHGRVR